MIPKYPPGKLRDYSTIRSILPQRGPLGPFGVSGDLS